MSDGLRISGLSVSFGEKKALTDFTAAFDQGSITALMGRSGCGKTTFLNVLMGIVRPQEGIIEGLPDSITAVFQEYRLCEDFSAVSNIRLITGKDVSEEEIRTLFHELGLTEEDIRKHVRDLSGGMKRRIAIARAIIRPGKLVLLDEPFGGLDKENMLAAARVIRGRCAGSTIILVTHDPSEAEALGAHILEMDQNGPGVK